MNVRFAPTLNDKLHLGNIRILIINYLYSKKKNVNLLLRVDEKPDLSTQIEQDNLLYVHHICSPKYLNIKFDNIIYQKHRHELYKQFLESIHPKYKVTVNNVIYLDIQSFISSEYIKYQDILYGTMQKKSYLINNCPIYNKATNMFFYNFTSVVDDIEQNISMIIRGADHIDNTYLQICIYHILNATIPQYMHIPLCFYQTRKMSKRANNIVISFTELVDKYYFIPNAISKALVGHYLNDNFDPQQISKKNKNIDIKLFDQFNLHYLKQQNKKYIQTFILHNINITLNDKQISIIMKYAKSTVDLMKYAQLLYAFETQNYSTLKELIVDHERHKTCDDIINKINYLFNIHFASTILDVYEKQYIKKVLCCII